jgi:hypothetical protein
MKLLAAAGNFEVEVGGRQFHSFVLVPVVEEGSFQTSLVAKSRRTTPRLFSVANRDEIFVSLQRTFLQSTWCSSMC